MLIGNTKQKNKKKLQLPLRVYLGYILLATLLFTGVSFSKFASTSSGQDGARVAVMASDASFTLNSIQMQPGTTYVEIPVTLTNKKNGRVCEVEQEYTLYVENITQNVDLTFTYYDNRGDLIMDNGQPATEVRGFFYAAAEATATYTIRISWEAPQPEDLSQAVDALRVYVLAEQVSRGAR